MGSVSTLDVRRAAGRVRLGGAARGSRTAAGAGRAEAGRGGARAAGRDGAARTRDRGWRGGGRRRTPARGDAQAALIGPQTLSPTQVPGEGAQAAGGNRDSRLTPRGAAIMSESLRA